MRGISAFGAIISIVSTFIACASFSEGPSDATPVDGGNGNVDSGSDGGSTGVDGGAVSEVDAMPPLPRTCAQRTGNPLICEDFESLNTLVDWTVQEANGGQLVTSPDAKRGGKVLDARIAPTVQNAQAQIERDKTWAPPFFVRFYAYMEEALADTSYHYLFVLSHMELGMLGGRVIVNLFDPLVMGQGFFEPSSDDFPLKKWTCVEWFVSPTSTTLSFDGVQQVSVSKPTNGATNFMSIGLGHNDEPTTGARSILYDDLVVSSTPVGCD